MSKYRKASEKTIARGKGKSTDELSLADAKDYFRERAKETGAKRFRHNGQVYDLDGNKVSEAPARSSRGGSSRAATSEGSTRPRANPARNPGGARPDPGKAGGMPAAAGKPKAESPGKRGEANPAVVAGLGAAGVAAGVAASRSGRKPSSGVSVSDKVRAAGAKVKAAAMGVPTKPKTPTTPKAAPSVNATPVKPKASPTPKGGGGRVGGAPVGARLRSGRGGRVLQMPDVMQLHLMNKGGMVKKK